MVQCFRSGGRDHHRSDPGIGEVSADQSTIRGREVDADEFYPLAAHEAFKKGLEGFMGAPHGQFEDPVVFQIAEGGDVSFALREEMFVDPALRDIHARRTCVRAVQGGRGTSARLWPFQSGSCGAPAPGRCRRGGSGRPPCGNAPCCACTEECRASCPEIAVAGLTAVLVQREVQPTLAPPHAFVPQLPFYAVFLAQLS